METEASHAVQDYAKAIYSLSRRGSETVATSALADRLDVSPASASAMAKRLAELGLVSHEPYHGVRLTDVGREARARGDPPPPADRAVPRRGARHAVGPRARRGRGARARDLRGAVRADRGEARRPDARPAWRSDPDSRRPHRGGRPRARSPRASRASASCSTRVSDSDPAMLRYLGERGIEPGTALEVVGREPFGGPLNVRVGRARAAARAWPGPRNAGELAARRSARRGRSGRTRRRSPLTSIRSARTRRFVTRICMVALIGFMPGAELQR